MIIEAVTPEDAKELLAIYSHYVKDTAVSFEHDVPTEEEFKQRIINISSRYPYIKATESGEILGYAYAGIFKGRPAYDWTVETTVYVRRDCRKKGIGRMLYTVLERSLCNIGICNMNACIAMPKTEDERLTFDSFLFHKKMGFTPVGTFHNCGCKFGVWYDVVWMEKLIAEHKLNPEEVRFGEWTVVL